MRYGTAEDSTCSGEVTWTARVHHVRGRLHFPLAATFHYSTDDPLVVHITFCPPRGRPVTWRVARDLLTAGSRVYAGTGDIRLGPAPGPGRDGQVHLRLGTPARYALFILDRARLVQGLARTHQLLSPGQEADHLDWPTIDRLLETGRPPEGRR